jgi:hypothetical protein
VRDAEALGGRFTGAGIIAQPPFEDKTYARARLLDDAQDDALS